jgi:hypothetical protein
MLGFNLGYKYKDQIIPWSTITGARSIECRLWNDRPYIRIWFGDTDHMDIHGFESMEEARTELVKIWTGP